MADLRPGPLDLLGSIKTKLGVLVGVSVLLAVLLGTVGAAAGLPAWLSVPVAVALSLGVTQLLAAGMISPLRQMTEVAQQMARGDYSGRVHTHATDEVGRLARAFNTMAEDLATVDRERRDLVATVSHELRTPLAGLQAVLENLADGVVPADEAHLREALERAERLSTLVRDLLDLSRLEAGVTSLAPEPVVLRELVLSCVEELESARGTTYDVRVGADLAVPADPRRLRQLVVNALDNAGRHGPSGGTVVVTAGAGGADWWLEIADSGPGIPATDRERVFERFGTSDAAATGGTGLGLAVARWVATLHGGTLRFVDPPSGATGARLRLQVPQHAPETPMPEEREMTTSTPLPPAPPPAPRPGPAPVADSLFAWWWPERGLPARRDVLAAALGTGVLGGLLMVERLPGLAMFVVLVAAGGTVLLAARHRRDPFTAACAVLCLVLCLPVLLRDAGWLQMLCLLAGGAVMVVGITRGTRVIDLVVAGLAWPLAGLRGLPWLGRCLSGLVGSGRAPAVLRTLLWSLAGVAIFGLLFASADALFASWMDRLLPDLTLDTIVLRVFLGLFVAGVTLAAAYLALNPEVLPAERGPARPLRHRFEWLAPVLLIDAVFVVFLASQATAFFGGHDYVEATTGLTYADYVHQGFGQLTVATALTLLVVWAAARRAGDDPADRLWLSGSLGVLCVLTLVVVASALYRMHLYQEAYGFTVLRLVVDVFEGWLGLLVVAVLVAGVWRPLARWLPRLALVSGALALVGLAAVNPDAWVAERNLDRYDATGSLDAYYLQSLSTDAAPVIAARLDPVDAGCILQLLPLNQLAPEVVDDWGQWNLGRHRAEDALARVDLPGATSERCRELFATPSP